MGRPKLVDGSALDHDVRARLTGEEYEWLQGKTKEWGWSLAQVLRFFVIAQKVGSEEAEETVSKMQGPRSRTADNRYSGL